MIQRSGMTSKYQHSYIQRNQNKLQQDIIYMITFSPE